MSRAGYDPFKAKWELYDLEKDFSQANDLAKDNPEKVEQLIALWWAEASKNNVLPLDWRGAERFSTQLTGKPTLAGDRTKFVYPGNFTGLPESSAPDLKNRSFTVSAKVDIKDNASGMIFTQGGNTGGWGFYMQDGTLFATHNFIDADRYTIKSSAKIPAGKSELKMTFTYESGKEFGKGGTVKLFQNAKQIGTGHVEKTAPFKFSFSEMQDIGLDTGTPIIETYETPFPFSGNIEEVTVELNQ